MSVSEKFEIIKRIVLFTIPPILGFLAITFYITAIINSDLIKSVELEDEIIKFEFVFLKIPMFIWLICLAPSIGAIFIKEGTIKTLFKWGCFITPLIYGIIAIIFTKAGIIAF